MDDLSALRRRAHHLDEVAAALEGSPAMTVHLRAGDTVWRGGSATVCRNDLVEVAAVVARTARALRAEAAECRRQVAATQGLAP